MIEPESEGVKLQESYLKQIMAMSSGGLGIVIALNETLLGPHSYFYFSSIILWMGSICVALLAQSRIATYYESTLYFLRGISDAEDFARKIGNEIDESKKPGQSGTKDFEENGRQNKNILKEKVERLRDTQVKYTAETKRIKVSEYLSLTLFLLGVGSIAVSLYLGTCGA